MMKHEFENLVGMTIDPACYERIEYVYMNSDKFNSKIDIAEFYKEKDMNGIEKIYQDLIAKETLTEEFKQYISDLAMFAESYNEEIKKHLAEISRETFKNKTIVKMLHEYSERLVKEKQQLLDDFWWNIRNADDCGIRFSNNSLTNSFSYKTVIAGFIVDDWWHNQCRKVNENEA